MLWVELYFQLAFKCFMYSRFWKPASWPPNRTDISFDILLNSHHPKLYLLYCLDLLERCRIFESCSNDTWIVCWKQFYFVFRSKIEQRLCWTALKPSRVIIRLANVRYLHQTVQLLSRHYCWFCPIFSLYFQHFKV